MYLDFYFPFLFGLLIFHFFPVFFQFFHFFFHSFFLFYRGHILDFFKKNLTKNFFLVLGNHNNWICGQKYTIIIISFYLRYVKKVELSHLVHTESLKCFKVQHILHTWDIVSKQGILGEVFMKISPFTDLGNNLLKFQTFHWTSSTKKGIREIFIKKSLRIRESFFKILLPEEAIWWRFLSTNMVPQIANFWNSFPLVLGCKNGNIF